MKEKRKEGMKVRTCWTHIKAHPRKKRKIAVACGYFHEQRISSYCGVVVIISPDFPDNVTLFRSMAYA